MTAYSSIYWSLYQRDKIDKIIKGFCSHRYSLSIPSVSLVLVRSLWYQSSRLFNPELLAFDLKPSLLRSRFSLNLMEQSATSQLQEKFEGLAIQVVISSSLKFLVANIKTIVCTQLTGKNYSTWRSQTLKFFRANGFGGFWMVLLPILHNFFSRMLVRLLAISFLINGC